MDEEDDLAGFLLGDESDAAYGTRRHNSSSNHRSRRKSRSAQPGDGGRSNVSSTSSLSNNTAESARDRSSSNPVSSSDEGGSGSSRSPPRRRNKSQGRQRRRKPKRLDSGREMDAALSSSNNSEEDGDLSAPARRTKKRQSRLKPKAAAEIDKTQSRDRHQPGEVVEARFGGRSKWFSGKVRRVHQAPTGQVLYDVSFDDGDEEEGVLAGRVRALGQCPPALRAGLAVDVKLARKGKGYHPGTIGRVNDDGSLYVKLDDGDSEWSVPSQQIIPIFPYMPATTPTRSDGGFENEKNRAATAESPGGVGAHGKRDEVDNQRGSKNSSSSLSTPAGKNRAVSGANREDSTEPRVSPDKAMLASSSSPEQEGEDCGAGDGEGADGVSWIAELANSVGVPSPAARSSPAAPYNTAGGNASDAAGEGSGLDWITDLVSTTGGGGEDRESPSPAEGHDSGRHAGAAARSSSGLPGNDGRRAFFPVSASVANVQGRAQPAAGVGSSEKLSVSHAAPARTPTAADAAPATTARGPRTPVATTTTSPRAVTPTHLEWKPIKDGSFNRTWGAPPPDAAATDDAADKDDTIIKTQQQQQRQQESPSSPPRLSRSTGASAFSPSAAAAAAAAAPANVRITKTAVTKSTPSVSSGPQDAETAPDSNTGGPRTRLTISVSKDAPSGRGSGSGAEVSPLPSGDGSTAVTKPAAEEAGPRGCDALAGEEGTQDSANDDANAPGRNPAGSRGDQGAPAPGIGTRDLCTETSPPSKAVSRAPSRGDVGEPHNSLAPLQGKVTTPRRGGSPESSRWEVLRSSVQRRYAAEAMHLSEEVRLLSAKLKAADDKADKRLAQQQRVLAAQMEEVLLRERDKAEALLSTERACSARRINGLEQELDRAKRQLELERNRSPKGVARDGHTTLRRRQSILSPPLQYNATGVRGRARASKTSDSNQRGGSRLLPTTALDRREAPARRPRSASSTTKTGSLPWEMPGKSGGCRPPPPPPLSLAAERPDGVRTRVDRDDTSVFPERSDGGPSPLTSFPWDNARGGSSGGGGDGPARDENAGDRFPEESLIGDFLTCAAGLASSDESKPRGQGAEPRRHPEHRQHRRDEEDGDQGPGKTKGGGGGVGGAKDRDTGPGTPPPRRRRQAQDALILERGVRHREEHLRWRFEMERKETRRRLEAMKGEVERVVGQFRTRAERAEAAAASAERRAAVKALRYLRSKRSASPPRG